MTKKVQEVLNKRKREQNRMGIQVEFNPDLALRNIQHYKSKERSLEECIPEKLEEKQVYNFLKKGQRNYFLLEEIPLLETKGNQELSRPLAAIVILEAVHFLKERKVYTKGRYLVEKVFDLNEEKINFEAYKYLKR